MRAVDSVTRPIRPMLSFRGDEIGISLVYKKVIT